MNCEHQKYSGDVFVLKKKPTSCCSNNSGNQFVVNFFVIVQYAVDLSKANKLFQGVMSFTVSTVPC